MKPIPINVHLAGIKADHTTFGLLLASLARTLGMTHWTQNPDRLTLRVDPNTPFVAVAAVIQRIAQHFNGAARWSGVLAGFQISAGDHK